MAHTYDAWKLRSPDDEPDYNNEPGWEPMETCPECGGEGCYEEARPQRDDPYYCEVNKCFTCNGTGWVES